MTTTRTTRAITKMKKGMRWEIKRTRGYNEDKVQRGREGTTRTRGYNKDKGDAMKMRGATMRMMR